MPRMPAGSKSSREHFGELVKGRMCLQYAKQRGEYRRKTRPRSRPLPAGEALPLQLGRLLAGSSARSDELTRHCTQHTGTGPSSATCATVPSRLRPPGAAHEAAHVARTPPPPPADHVAGPTRRARPLQTVTGIYWAQRTGAGWRGPEGALPTAPTMPDLAERPGPVGRNHDPPWPVCFQNGAIIKRRLPPAPPGSTRGPGLMPCEK